MLPVLTYAATLDYYDTDQIVLCRDTRAAPYLCVLGQVEADGHHHYHCCPMTPETHKKLLAGDLDVRTVMTAAELRFAVTTPDITGTDHIIEPVTGRFPEEHLPAPGLYLSKVCPGSA